MELRYLLFYKPYNVLAQFSKPEPDRVTLQDFIAVPEVYPVGRLDQDSEGLLLLTNDTTLHQRLTDPQHHFPKTYWVQVEGSPQLADLQSLRQGVTIRVKQKTHKTLPAQVQALPTPPLLPPRHPPIRYRAAIPTAWLEIVLVEGKNRQIRKMTAAVGLPTLRLVRAKIGELTLDALQPGEWRPLKQIEIQQIKRPALR